MAGVGTWGLFDRVDLTADSEYESREGEEVDTLVIHHATCLTYRSLRVLMDPGGRTVSANGGMANDGTLYEIVPANMRSYCSASGFDRRAFTVEACNISLDPDWRISPATRTRFAELAVAMFKLGNLKTLSRTYGRPGGIIGHFEVPGTYPTACPGPDMDLDAISAEAKAIYADGEEDDDMTPSISKSGSPTPMTGEFVDLLLTAGGDKSLVIGPARVNVVARAVIRGLEAGKCAELRYVRAVPVQGKGTTYRSEGVGFKGGVGEPAFGQVTGIVDLKKGERLRVQAKAPKGVTIDWDVDYRVKQL